MIEFLFLALVIAVVIMSITNQRGGSVDYGCLLDECERLESGSAEQEACARRCGVNVDCLSACEAKDENDQLECVSNCGLSIDRIIEEASLRGINLQ